MARSLMHACGALLPQTMTGDFTGHIADLFARLHRRACNQRPLAQEPRGEGNGNNTLRCGVWKNSVLNIM